MTAGSGEGRPGAGTADRQGLERQLAVSLRAGRLDDAERTLESLVAAWPDNVDYRLELAAVCERQSKRADAESCYRELVRRMPDNPLARFNFACFLRRMGQVEEALLQHQRAIDLRIDKPEEVHSNIGVILGELHRHDDAAKHFRRALAINPDYVPALYNLGLLHEEFGDRPGALALFHRILRVDPGWYDALVRIAHAQRVHDPDDEIVRKLRRALRRTQLQALTRESLHFAMGKVLDDCGRYEEAFAHFELGNRCAASRLRAYDAAARERRTSQIIEVFASGWLARMQPVSERPLVFITGLFRTGSTLFEQVLAAHPRVTPGGEIDYFGPLLNGAPVFPGAFRNPEPDAWRKLGMGYVEYLEKTFPAGKLVTNKRPDAFELLGLLKGLFPHARFINTVREPLDTVLSIYFQQLDDRFGYASSLDNIAHHYLQYRRLMEHWKTLFGESIFDASYDQYVNDREPTTRAMLGFLGLEWNERCLEFQSLENRIRTASVWQVREPVYRKSSGRWRNYEKHLQRVRQVLAQ